MQLIQNILSFNQILTVSLLGWLVAQVLKTIIADFCGGLCGGYHHHARCHGRAA